MSDIITSPLFSIDCVENLANDIHVYTQTSKGCLKCPTCGSSDIHQTHQLPEMYLDVPLQDKRVSIILKRRHYECASCLQAFPETIPFMHKQWPMTEDCVYYIEAESFSKPFKKIAIETGCSEKVVSDIFNDYQDRINGNKIKPLPEWIALHDIHIGTRRCMITPILESNIITILEDRRESTLRKYLSAYDEFKHVKYVLVQMTRAHTNVVRELMPKATVVLDKSHVLDMAMDAMHQVRKSVRRQITQYNRRNLSGDAHILSKRRHELNSGEIVSTRLWSVDYPDVMSAFNVKEEFFAIWEQKSVQKAKNTYEAWLKKIPPEIEVSFRPLVEAMSVWHLELFNGFKVSFPDQHAQFINQVKEEVVKGGCDYAYEAIRVQLLMKHTPSGSGGSYTSMIPLISGAQAM